MRFSQLAGALAAALIAAGAAQATEVAAHIEWYPGSSDGGESFDFNTADGVIDGDYLVFATTNDSLNQNYVAFGDANLTGAFATGSGEATLYEDYFNDGMIPYYQDSCCSSSPLFDGVTPVLLASPDTSYVAYGASEFSFSALAAPEPRAWALMILGAGAIGVMLRRNRSRRPARA